MSSSHPTIAPGSSGKRTFLFLQGVISPFFRKLAEQLRREGHEVYRVNFCGGDALSWGVQPGWHYRDSPEEFPDYLDQRFRRHAFSDVVLFGDQRPVHRMAIEVAKRHGARVLVFEEGYVRPNWVTLDRGGVNAHSSLPRDPRWYRAVDRNLPRYGEGQPASSKLVRRASYDIGFHLTNALVNPFCFRNYRTHRPEGAAVEYAGWLRRFSHLSHRTAADGQTISAVIESRRPYFFLPLQLNSDAQIRTHSPFGSMAEVIERVMTSFSRHAPVEALLLVKNHPLDTGLVPYERIIRSLERALDLSGRVHFLESGHLPTLLEHSSGVVTVNSTTGMSSLVHQRPTLALGCAIYDLPGLTHQGGLDEFWRHPESPDDDLFHAFRNVVIHTTQANGNFYEPHGIALILESGRRLLQARSPLDELL